MKRSISVILSLVLLLHCAPLSIFAADADTKAFSPTLTLGEAGGYLAANTQIVKHLSENSFSTSHISGSGFSAENASNLTFAQSTAAPAVDGKIINRGGSNVFVQNKYFATAAESIENAFDKTTGKYLYVKNNRPMQLEVPANQYDEAVQMMMQKIRDGFVFGVNDPGKAEELVKKGNLTYKQVANIAKAGNVDSLLYDSYTGAITATCGTGIAFAIDYACCILNGIEPKASLKAAALNGLKTGGIIFATHIISSQLAKTGAIKAFVPTAAAIANTFGDDLCRAILTRSGIDTLGMSSKALTSNVTKILSKELIADGVLIVVLTSMDVVDLFKGRISKEELLKNLTVTIITIAAGTVGGIGGGALGTLIAPGIGTTIGTLVGSTIIGSTAGLLSELSICKFYESDADKMFNIISDEFLILCEEYLISEQEGIAITEQLQEMLIGDILKDMYAAEDRTLFAKQMLEPLFANHIKERTAITIPTEEEVRREYKSSMQGIVFIH